MTTWYGKVFKADAKTRLASYWNSSICFNDLESGRCPRVLDFSYGGPGGCAIDANLWLLDSQLLRLRHDLHDLHEYDDIWVSYVLDGLLGWGIRRLVAPVPLDISSLWSESRFNRLHSLVEEQDVAKLNEIRIQLHDEVRAAATFANGTSLSDTKADVFDRMQTEFRWNVIDSSTDCNDACIPRIERIRREKSRSRVLRMGGLVIMLSLVAVAFGSRRALITTGLQHCL